MVIVFPRQLKRGFLFVPKCLSSPAFLYAPPPPFLSLFALQPQVHPRLEVRLRGEAVLHRQDLLLRLFLAFGPRKVSESLGLIASKDLSESGRDFHKRPELRTRGELRYHLGKAAGGSMILFRQNQNELSATLKNCGRFKQTKVDFFCAPRYMVIMN